ncbi:Bug family tripartite tricarboxylate transporter substrate binding protein [Variovorax terrae]|uniref:Tripartite tricarboxylate transporter substrate binding protein n=1 Tax=Variovorax terrae TaxID=2923278 RepID=A0A9X1VXP0_9BURK|nr:tripartite tricarboxylate transporter substrate binding protein [Variovorax terrae]MCJ0765701.1 tripartite tricarboxylate transporter substrate binding protein [Variovorax terrae]
MTPLTRARRGFVLALLPLLMAAGASHAQNYPSKAVTIVVGTEAGGSPDLIARILGTRLGAQLGRPVIVENRPGAAGTVGAAQVARAQPDGHTLFLGTVSSHAIARSVYPALSYDPETSFAPVGQVASVPLILVVRADSKARTVKDLVTMAQAQPGKLNYASPGSGGPQHLASELFMSVTGTRLAHIPYKSGAAAITAVLAGDVDMFFAGMPPALAQIQAGKLRGLLVTTASRFPAVPDVPTAREAGLEDFEVDNWHALFAPAGTPLPVLQRLNHDIGVVLQDLEVRAQFVKIGATAKGGEPVELARLVKAEAGKWARIVKSTGTTAN